MTAPLIYQSTVARALGMSWAKARDFVEAQGFETFARDARPRTWAMATRDWDALAVRIGLATPAQLAASLRAAAQSADAVVASPAHRARRCRERGSSAQSA